MLRVDPERGTLICGHRGAPSLAPENTLLSFELALAAGAELIECDVRLARCGAPVVFHDRTLRRLLGVEAALDAWDAAALEAADLGDGVWVPTLEAFLELGRGRCQMLVEVKETRAVAGVIAAIERLGVGDQVLVQSFLPEVVRALGRVGAGLCAGQLIGRAEQKIERLSGAVAVAAAAEVGAAFVGVEYALLEAPLLADCHAAGLPVAVWTVNEGAHLTRALALGVDVLITDRPQDARALRVQMGWEARRALAGGRPLRARR